ncbi:MAG: DUF4147 domain-containing protein [Thermodesulfobacteriota bacterium]
MINKDVFEIFKESVSAVLPESAIKNSLSVSKGRLSIQGKTYNLKKYKNVYIFGVGKASIKMAKELEKLLGGFLKTGFVVGTKEESLNRSKTYISDHPVPSKRSIKAGKELKKEMGKLAGNDFFIFMLSGGASSLVEIPKKTLTLSDIQNTTERLLACGADITEINMIRKALSDLKGGKLTENIKADGVAVVISDVIQGGIEAIGSAPMFSKKLPDRADIKTIIHRYGLKEKLSQKVLEIIENYEPAGSSQEFDHHIVVDNQSAVKAGVKKALELGYQAFEAPFQLEGEAREMAKKTAAYIKNLKKENSKIPICIVIGGETTVTLKGHGKGGRNQEFVLAMMRELKDSANISYFSGGTDGIDGNSDYAGAFGSRQIYEKSVEKNLDIDEYLNNNDSTTFFQETGGVLKTGYTGTNVADIAIILKE